MAQNNPPSRGEIKRLQRINDKKVQSALIKNMRIGNEMIEAIHEDELSKFLTLRNSDSFKKLSEKKKIEEVSLFINSIRRRSIFVSAGLVGGAYDVSLSGAISNRKLWQQIIPSAPDIEVEEMDNRVGLVHGRARAVSRNIGFAMRYSYAFAYEFLLNLNDGELTDLINSMSVEVQKINTVQISKITRGISDYLTHEIDLIDGARFSEFGDGYPIMTQTEYENLMGGSLNGERVMDSNGCDFCKEMTAHNIIAEGFHANCGCIVSVVYPS